MWVFTNKGFFSIVEDRNNSYNLLVRARMKGDLERVFGQFLKHYDLEVSETTDSDYRFRVSLPRHTVDSVISAEVDGIDYDNFKNSYRDNEEIPQTIRSLMHYHMHDAWEAMWKAQKSGQTYEEAEVEVRKHYSI